LQLRKSLVTGEKKLKVEEEQRSEGSKSPVGTEKSHLSNTSSKKKEGGRKATNGLKETLLLVLLVEK